MSKTTRYPRLARAIFVAAALCGIFGFVQAEGFFVLSAFLGLVGIILRRGVSPQSKGHQFEFDPNPIGFQGFIPLRRKR
ncbi:MAG: hypothetical protein QGI08_15905 [Paracoccaceae bacterium]|jgi:hypothetical protein|nr:hypothetical protein [Paracoccaceae bacterium]MDP7187198.1 hypothetical protein [Paracoccaceae bacterium]